MFLGLALTKEQNPLLRILGVQPTLDLRALLGLFSSLILLGPSGGRILDAAGAWTALNQERDRLRSMYGSDAVRELDDLFW